MSILLVHTAATLLMVGAILVVQWVHYPLLRRVGGSKYRGYHAEHMRRITWVVAPLMSIELITAFLLLWHLPVGVTMWQAGVGLALLSVIWGSTALIQVPLHNRLSDGFDDKIHRQLVETNRLRTGAWLLRGGLVLWMMSTSG